MSDQVTIRIPASTQHVGVVRAAASALAALLDFSYERLMDLHIAIDEACSRVLATSSPPASRLEIRFGIEEGHLEVAVRGDSASRDGSDLLNPWSRVILESVTDGVDVESSDGALRLLFRFAGGEAD